MGDLGRTWWILCVGLGLGAPNAHAVTYTLNRSAILTSQPSFEMRHRIELDPLDVIVKGPALEQRGQFCRYELMNRRQEAIKPKFAWTPCYSIDKVFSAPCASGSCSDEEPSVLNRGRN